MSNRTSSKLYTLLFVCFLCFPTQAHSEEKVTLQLKWKHQFQFAGYYMAKEMGLYKSAGLDVTIIEAKPGIEPIEQVLQKKADFGVGNTDIVRYRAEGKPVVVLGVIFQHSPLAIATRNEKGKLLSLQDIVAMPMMIEAHSADIWAYFENEGINKNNLNLVEHSFDPKDLIDNKVQSMSVYITSEIYDLKKADFPFQVFYPRAAGIDFYGDNLFTTESMINSNPDLVKAFLNASKAGWKYAMNHQEETAEIIYKRYSKRFSKEQLLFEAKQMESLIQADIIEPGYMNDERWNYIIDTYIQLNLLDKRPSLEGFLYSSKTETNFSELYKLIALITFIVIALALLLSRFIWINSQLKNEIKLRNKVEQELRASATALENAMQSAEQANDFKGRFLAVVGHDLRTPLTAIIGFVEQALIHLRKNIDSEKELHMILKNSRYIQKMLGDLSDLSQVESGTLKVKPVMTNFPSLLMEIEYSFQNEALLKHIEFKKSIHWPLPKFIYLDATRLRQVINNLLSNAIKFTDTGSVTLDISLKGNGLFFQIIDTGLGIDESKIKNLFEPFHQSHDNIKSNYGGTGLGLYISKELIEKMGGVIGVNSKHGVGSTFYFKVPIGIDQCELIDETQYRSENKLEITHIKHSTQGSVLLAEDVADNSELIKLILQSPNIQLDIVSDGKAALDAIENKHYDLVLMDIQMPIMNGDEVVTLLRQKQNYLPVIALTAISNETVTQAYLELGFDGLLEKPIDRKALIDLVESYLNENDNRLVIANEENNPPESIASLKNKFLQRLPKYLTDLHNILLENDFKQLAIHAHKHVGSSGNLYSMEMSRLLKELEQAAKEQDVSSCQKLIKKLQNLVQ